MDNQINVSDSLINIIHKLSEGNPGAIEVILQLIEIDKKTAMPKFLILHELNLHGPAIWIGYKDYCGQDINKFIECIDKRDPEMMVMIKKEMGQNG
jgi:hypothetical protein